MTGILSREGVSPHSRKTPIPAPMAALRRTSAARFLQRPRASGFRNAEALWSDAMGQVFEGWVIEPLEFPDNGDIPFFSICNTNAAFRFRVSQGAKLRACDDLRHCLVNSRTVVRTQSPCPTWATMLRWPNPPTYLRRTGLSLRAIVLRHTNRFH